MNFEPEVALLLHAYRSGKPWLSAADAPDIPFVTMLTGTDINVGLDDIEQRPLIEEVIKKSASVLLQNPLLAKSFADSYPGFAMKLRVINPGVRLGTEPYNLRQRHKISDNKVLFLCPAGIRPVKMQKELLELFDTAIPPNDNLELAFSGPVLNSDYGEDFFAELADRPWAKYLGSIPPEAMASAMQKADVIVNNSLAEGISNSLLEAATLGIPILARNNPGNAAVIQHNVNGLLYDQPCEGVAAIRVLLEKKNRKKLSRPDTRYNLETEAVELEDLLNTTIIKPVK